MLVLTCVYIHNENVQTYDIDLQGQCHGKVKVIV